MRFGLHHRYPQGRLLPVLGLFLRKELFTLLLLVGESLGMPTPLLPAGAPCPSRLQQRGFFITRAASELVTRNLQPESGSRRLLVVGITLDFHRMLPQRRGVIRKCVAPRATRSGGDDSPHWMFSVKRVSAQGSFCPCFFLLFPLFPFSCLISRWV